jgi:hypothetical protein
MTEPSYSVADSDAADALHAALALVRPRAADLTNDDLSFLRERLFAAVDQMRADGVSPKQAVARVKALATEAGLQWISIELIDRLANWCAERYEQR